MRVNRDLKRTNLFLLRTWVEEVEDAGPGSDVKRATWRGRVQRVVDGEVHEFDGWQGLVDLLSAMMGPRDNRDTDGQKAADPQPGR